MPNESNIILKHEFVLGMLNTELVSGNVGRSLGLSVPAHIGFGQVVILMPHELQISK